MAGREEVGISILIKGGIEMSIKAKLKCGDCHIEFVCRFYDGEEYIHKCPICGSENTHRIDAPKIKDWWEED